MIILITGGASGLGESITRKLSSYEAFTVYFTFNSSSDSAKKIETDFSNAFGIKCDFRNNSDINSLNEWIAQTGIDLLINNAWSGSFLQSHFHKTLMEDFLIGFRNDILPTLSITQAAISCFRKKKSGKIITLLTSGLLNTPPAGSSVYISNKAYLAQLSKVWASENAKYNITSNTISPSFMQTNLTAGTDERILDQIINNHPLKKLLSTEEVAEVVYFLSTASNHINGVDIVLNAAVDIK